MAGTCEWFALCANPATTTEPHPILGEVPICDRCQAKAHAIRDAGRRPAHSERDRWELEEQRAAELYERSFEEDFGSLLP